MNTIRLCFIASILLISHTLVAAYEMAYALFDRPFADDSEEDTNIYYPSVSFQSECNAPVISIKGNKSPGLYIVHVGESMMGKNSNVQVTSRSFFENEEDGFCNVVNWSMDGDVHVQCRDAIGTPVSRSFAVLVVKYTMGDYGKAAFTWLYDSAGSFPSTSPPPPYSFGIFPAHAAEEAASGTTYLERISVGQYQLVVGSQIDPAKAAVFVTAYENGSPPYTTAGYCNVQSWSLLPARGGEGQDEVPTNNKQNGSSLLKIACFDPRNGFPIDTSSSVLIVSSEMKGVSIGWRLSSLQDMAEIVDIMHGTTTSPTLAPPVSLSEEEQSDSHDGIDNSSQLKIERIGKGQYSINAFGEDPDSFFSYWYDHAQVTVYGSDARCAVTSWPSNSSSVAGVQCFDPQGLSADSEFVVATLMDGTVLLHLAIRMILML